MSLASSNLCNKKTTYLTLSSMLNPSFLTTLLALFLSSAAIAQSTASVDNTTEIDWANFEVTLEDTDNWSFHTNAEGKLLYIDFESLGGKMSRLVVKSEQESVVVEDNHLYDLPVNTIYEVNLENLDKGRYFVELYTYQQELISKEITVQ